MTSKIWPHALHYQHRGPEWVKQGGLKGVLLCEAMGLAPEYATAGAVYIIGRREEQTNNLTLDVSIPVRDAATKYVDELAAHVIASPDCTHWIVPGNEKKTDTPELMDYYARLCYEVAKQLWVRYRRRAVLGNWAVGNPSGTPPQVEAIWAKAGPLIAACKEFYAVLGFHEYTIPELEWDKWHLGRFEDVIVLLRKYFNYTPDVILSEFGFDFLPDLGKGGGWSDLVSAERYVDFIIRMDKRFQALPYVKGVCLFTGGYGWPKHSVDKEEIIQPLIAYARTQMTTICANNNAPPDWNYTVTGAQGLNVRTSPDSTQGSKNLLCAMPTGQKVVATEIKDNWARITFPTAGYCFAPNLLKREVLPATVLPKPGVPATFENGTLVIDVSANQHPDDVDWLILAMHGYRVAVIRISVGAMEDAYWRTHYTRAKAAGFKIALYTAFSFTVPVATQLKVLRNAVMQSGINYLPSLSVDLELPRGNNSPDNAKQFVEALEHDGFHILIYTRKSWIDSDLPDAAWLAKYPLWVANYLRPAPGSKPVLPKFWTASVLWQYVAGEKVVTEKMHWGYAKTIKGNHLDESVVTNRLTLAVQPV